MLSTQVTVNLQLLSPIRWYTLQLVLICFIVIHQLFAHAVVLHVSYIPLQLQFLRAKPYVKIKHNLKIYIGP